MKILSVIPLKKGILKGDLTYFTSLDIPVGHVVTVPIRNQKTLALVTSSENLKEAKGDIKGMDFNLRKVIEDKGNSIFLQGFLEAVVSSSTYFAQNKNNAITSLIPNIFIEEYDTLVKIGNEINNDSAKDTKNGEDKKNQKNLRTEKLLLQYPLADRISIYKTLIRESFARGKSVYIVLPTQSDIEKFSSQLSKGIEQFTFSVHSGQSAKKNLLTYEKIMTSLHPVLIVGTPPFLSIPKKDIGTIILEHENSNAYRMVRRPHFDLRVFTELYAAKSGAKLILADELLRLETIGRIDADMLPPLHPLSFRINFEGEIEVSTKRPRHIPKEAIEKEEKRKFRILDDQSIEEMRNCLESKKSVFVFSLRKGLATVTVCNDCGEEVRCKTCGAPLVLYLSHQGKKRMFVCNKCVEEMDGDTACVSCGSWNLMPLGIGTDTVFEEAARIFPDVPIFKLDKESVQTANGAKKIIKEFEETPGSILIGTEMAFFYLREKVDLSIIASFDSLWSIPNFKMGEKIVQIALSIIATTTRKLIIQTKNENDSTIRAIVSGNLLSFVREELEDREKLGYPPFKRFIKISYAGEKKEAVRARALLQEIFASHAPEIFSGFLTRAKGAYVTNALIKIEPKVWSLPELSPNSGIDEYLLQKLTSLPPAFEVFVDPEDLL